MRNLYYRLAGAIACGLLVFKRPELTSHNVLGGITGLYDLMFKVAEEKRPFMCKIGCISVVTGEKTEIVTVWCGHGAGSNPTDRITELCAEIDALKRELAKALSEKGQKTNE